MYINVVKLIWWKQGETLAGETFQHSPQETAYFFVIN